MIASDNVRDPFYAYGDLDMLEVWREGVRILHLDYPFADWASAVRSNSARAMGLEIPPRCSRRHDHRQGARLHRAFRASLADRLVLRAGRPSLAPPPDYAEIDSLEGIAS